MALSLTDIELNCNRGLEIAGDLSREADELQTQLGLYQVISSDLQASWTGVNATGFAGAMSEIASQISSQIEGLRNLSSAIERTVEVYRDQQTSLYNEEQEERRAKAKSTGGGGSHMF